jgi:hypothetical protein
MAPEIVEGDWVLICETNEKGVVEAVFDKGERFLVVVEGDKEWPHPKRFHVMVEKLRRIRTPKPKKLEVKWHQITLL